MELEKQIQVLMDIESIKNLKRMYCYWADAGIAGNSEKMDELVDHFAENAMVDFDMFGIHKGKENIAKFFKEVVCGVLSYSSHMVANPIIQVDGDEASGKWYVDVPCTFKNNDQAVWLQGKYEETYVRENGIWKWSSMIVRFDFITPFEEGWAKTRVALPS